MSGRVDIYGFASSTLEEARAIVEHALGGPLAFRESDARGVFYRAGTTTAGVTLYSNRRGDLPRRADYAEWPVLLVVSDIDDIDGLQHRLIDGGGEPTLLSSVLYPEETHDES